MRIGSHASRPACDHREHPAVAEDAFGGRADVGLRHGANQAVAAGDVVDAETLEGDLRQTIQRNPWQSVAVGVAVGWVLSRIFGRRR